MTIKKLIVELMKFDPSTEIVISGDPEGNDYRTIDYIGFIEVAKMNNNGSREVATIYPTDTLLDVYDPEEE